MKDNYDFSNAVVNDFSKKISDTDKLKIMLNAYKVAKSITKEELRREVNLILG